ncbi:Uu.00g131690.m01.CDS01 [Anthostomella pinea]|uniref:Uu.00g131690.m01.CDS01 n=1 Tax=Anthostomella pinea TaxID=933095 RepID=A0AAI8YI68_9PEZI|nr:Uu.00g131690.m01.CDS01 [Anthostomella pinea]
MSATAHASKTYSFSGDNLDDILGEIAMAIPMLLALTICPAILGTQEAIRQSQSKNEREEHRARRCNLVVSCVKQSIRSRDINGKLVVLKDNKLYITTTPTLSDDEEALPAKAGYPFSGYYLPYPDTPYEGIVSTVSDDPPMLNWIYVDKNTYEVKYGLRVDAQDHITGPFDCTRQDRRMTLEGWEGFAAAEEFPGVWALYFDRDDDGLVTKVPMGTRVLEVELTRREKKERKPEPDPSQAQTLDEKMKQHKENTQKEEEDRQAFYQTEDLQAQANEQPAAVQQEDTPAAIEGRIGQLSIDAKASSNLQEHLSPTTTRSPSALTDNLSLWSAARGAGEADDTVSVTVASSVMDRNDAPEAGAAETEDQGYKKPYVEEAVADDAEDDDVDR